MIVNSLPQKFFNLLLTRWTVLLNLLLAVLLCWQLAQWTWIFLAPVPPRPVAVTSTQSTEQMLASVRAAHLFGVNAEKSNAPQALAVTPLNLKLSGVFAATGRLPAVAIIKVENKGDLPFMTGDEILPEVKLEQVWPDHAVISRGGVMENLPLEQKGQALILQKAPARLNVRREGSSKFVVSKNELQKILSDPGQLANLGRITPVPGQGMRVDEARAGSLMSQVGLKGGDMIRSINGKPAWQATDLLQNYRQGGQIRLEGTRNGQPFEYNYSVR